MEEPEKQTRKALGGSIGIPGESALDVQAIEPDELRDAVRDGLTALSG